MGEILDLAEALWTGEATTYQHHPFSPPHGLEKVADEYLVLSGILQFNLSAIQPKGWSLSIPGHSWDSRIRFEAIRADIASLLNTAIFSHGHVPTTFSGWTTTSMKLKRRTSRYPKAIAHESHDGQVQALPRNPWMERCHKRPPVYRQQQPGCLAGRIPFSGDYLCGPAGIGRRRVYGSCCAIQTGRPMTTPGYFSRTRGVLCTGDLFIWAVPNGGNPQKVQRYLQTMGAGSAGDGCAES